MNSDYQTSVLTETLLKPKVNKNHSEWNYLGYSFFIIGCILCAITSYTANNYYYLLSLFSGGTLACSGLLMLQCNKKKRGKNHPQKGLYHQTLYLPDQEAYQWADFLGDYLRRPNAHPIPLHKQTTGTFRLDIIASYDQQFLLCQLMIYVKPRYRSATPVYTFTEEQAERVLKCITNTQHTP